MTTFTICAITAALFQNLRIPELIIIAILILLLFGGRKIPELMRGIGEGVRSFKQGLNDITDEIADKATKDDSQNKDKKK